MRPETRPARGFTTIEMMVGFVVGALVLAGAFRLWKTAHVEAWRIGKKVELRSQLALSNKRIQRAVTLAGIGLRGAASMVKDDAVGSDTLTIFLNVAEKHCSLINDVLHYQSSVRVDTPSFFAGVDYLALSDSAGGEVRRITGRAGTTLYLSAPFSRDFARASSAVQPAAREKFYTDQSKRELILATTGGLEIVAGDIRNFQVSFLDRNGRMTESTDSVRSVAFSFTGVYPSPQGALNSIVFSSTAIPRNIQ